MNRQNRDPLDIALDSLTRHVAPSRDLWPAIRAEVTAPATRQPGIASRYWYQAAAAVLLVATSSIVTYGVMQRATEGRVLQAQQVTVQQMQPVLSSMPASFGGQDVLGPEYVQARAALEAQFTQRLALLPSGTRAKLERDLADLRRAANEVSATLSAHPSDALLQELLLSTYQRELALLASVSDVTQAGVTGADL